LRQSKTENPASKERDSQIKDQPMASGGVDSAFISKNFN
jgi:hypothetical protein